MSQPTLAKLNNTNNIELANALRAQQINWVATFDSIEELIEAQNIKGVELAQMLMAVNTTLKCVADQLDSGVLQNQIKVNS